jgi:hypothetical protein
MKSKETQYQFIKRGIEWETTRKKLKKVMVFRPENCHQAAKALYAGRYRNTKNGINPSGAEGGPLREPGEEVTHPQIPVDENPDR